MSAAGSRGPRGCGTRRAAPSTPTPRGPSRLPSWGLPGAEAWGLRRSAAGVRCSEGTAPGRRRAGSFLSRARLFVDLQVLVDGDCGDDVADGVEDEVLDRLEAHAGLPLVELLAGLLERGRERFG